MRAERWERIKQAFDCAVDLGGEERQRFLDSACSADPELRQEVDRLIAEYEIAGDFLNATVLDFFGSPSSLARDQLIAGRYRIIRQLGCGGMGEVYEAQDGLLGESIALKTLRPEFASNRNSWTEEN